MTNVYHKTYPNPIITYIFLAFYYFYFLFLFDFVSFWGKGKFKEGVLKERENSACSFFYLCKGPMYSGHALLCVLWYSVHTKGLGPSSSAIGKKTFCSKEAPFS